MVSPKRLRPGQPEAALRRFSCGRARSTELLAKANDQPTRRTYPGSSTSQPAAV